MEIIKKVDKKELQDFLYNLNLEDVNIYNEINNSSTIGIFQFNGALASGITKQVKPTNFNELIAINSLARPGTSSFVPDYIAGRDEGVAKYPEKVSALLKETYNLCIFQEQVMNIFNVIGGFSLEETNDIRSLMKKLGKADKSEDDIKKWDKAISKFTKGAIKNNLTKEDASLVAEDLLMMSSYNFNKCFSGDCEIDTDNMNSWSPTIEEMYLAKNDIEWARDNKQLYLRKKYEEGYGFAFSLNDDKKLFPNKIIDIYFQGEKEVFEISLDDGKKIEVTRNHSFPVLRNEEIIYQSIETGLDIGSTLFSNEEYRKSYSLLNNEVKKKGEYKETNCVKIVSIKSKGMKNTYDVEMANPYHTLSVNGIVAKNSHATSYSYIAVMTLYLSYYFKKYFLSSVLQNHIEDSKGVFETIQSIKSQGAEILPPDINNSQIEVSVLQNDVLLFGLKNIKKVSETSAENIIAHRPYKNLFDFILKTDGKKVRVDVIKALISVGAFDFETPERKRLLLALEIFWNNKKSTKVREKLQIIWDKSYKEAMNMKGLNISNSDLKEFENEYFGGNFFTSSFPNNLLSAFKKLRDKNLIYYSFNEVTAIPKKVPFFIQSIKLHTDKNANEMAFITVEDVTGRTERLPIFASFWKHIKDMISDSNYCFIQVYLTEDSFMFGSPRWVSNKKEIERMVKIIE